MKHLSDFNSFNEKHIYDKAASTKSKNWMENYKKFISYVKKMIEERQLTDFEEKGNLLNFKIKGRKYVINKNKKICIYKKEKGNDTEIELELTDENLSELITALKKPLKSKRADEPTKKFPDGRKPYLKD